MARMTTIPLTPWLDTGVKLLRVAQGMSQEDRALRVGVGVSTISRIERDQHVPTPVELAKILGRRSETSSPRPRAGSS